MLCDKQGKARYDSDHLAILGRPDYRYPPDHPATLEAIRAQVSAAIQPPKSCDPFVFYLHNHGTSLPEPRVSLWGGQELNLTEFRKIAAEIPESSRIIVVSDSCRGGALIGGMIRKADGSFRRNTCGFSPASPDESAYEGSLFMEKAAEFARARDHAQAESMGVGAGETHFTFGQVHRELKKTIAHDSIPYSSGDAFLTQFADTQASAQDLKGQYSRLIGHCLFAGAGLDLAVKGLDEPFKTTARALLSEQVERLRAELKRGVIQADLNEAGLTQNSTYPELEKIVGERKAKLRNLEEAADKAYDGWIPARTQWLKSRLGNRDFDCWQILKAEANSALPPSEAQACSGLPKGKAARNTEFIRLNTNIDRERFAAPKNPKFQELVASGGRAPNTWPPKSLTQWKDADKAADEEVGKLRTFKAFESTVKSANALETMLDHGKTEDLANYLNILQCEETPMGKLPI